MRKIVISDRAKIQILKSVAVGTAAAWAVNALQVRIIVHRYNDLSRKAHFAAIALNKFVDLAPEVAAQVKDEVDFDWIVQELSQ